MAKHPEANLQTQIRKWVRENVVAHHVFLAFDRSAKKTALQHIMEARKGQRSGTPDVCLLVEGAAIWTELKAPAGVLSVLQKELHAEMNIAGFHVSVIRSVRGYADDLVARHVHLRVAALERADALDRLLGAPALRLGKTALGKPRVLKPSPSRVRRAETIRQKVMF